MLVAVHLNMEVTSMLKSSKKVYPHRYRHFLRHQFQDIVSHISVFVLSNIPIQLEGMLLFHAFYSLVKRSW